ncbi:MAG: site-specific integrase [Melioribacteraceae bacterium]|nr:site-specific integrase [Melioribacteraceae bacterium]
MYTKKVKPPTKPKLLDQVRHVLRRERYSKKTEEAYTKWIREFIIYHNKQHPKKLSKKHIENFLTHLAVDRQVAPSTQTQALSALVFLYKKVLDGRVRMVGRNNSCYPQK